MALDGLGAERRVSRRAATAGLAAGAAALAGAARAQNASGVGHYVPYNCRPIDNGLGGAVGVSGGGPLFQYTCKPTSDLSLITILLNLEYLAASYYLLASTGVGLSAADQGGRAQPVSGGRKVSFSSPVTAAYAAQLAADSRLHVTFLRGLIASTGVVPASRPFIALDDGFNVLMQQAGIVASGQTFDAFASDRNFLLGAYAFEDLLVSAYRGTVPALANAATIDPISGLLATKGYHAGIVRTLLFGAGSADATNAISYSRDKLDGSAGTPTQGNDHGVGTTARATILNGDGNAIVAPRTQDQVMRIVFNAQAAALPTYSLPIFFFPQGLSSPT